MRLAKCCCAKDWRESTLIHSDNNLLGRVICLSCSCRQYSWIERGQCFAMRSLCGRCSSVVITFMSPHQPRDNSHLATANKSWPIRNNSKAKDVELMASADDRFESDWHLDDQPTGTTVCSCDHSRSCHGKFFAVHTMAQR